MAIVEVKTSEPTTLWMLRAKDMPELLSAFITAQAKFEVPKRTKTANIKTYSYKYSTLEDLIAATRPALAENGLGCINNVTMPAQNVVCVSAVLFHSSGQIIESDPLIFQVDGSPQATGSAITYGRRYSMSAMLGVAAEDDNDTQQMAGSERTGKNTKPQPQEQEAPPVDPAVANEPITEAQVLRLRRIAKQHGVDGVSMKTWLQTMDIAGSSSITKGKYDAIVLAVQGGKVPIATKDDK